MKRIRFNQQVSRIGLLTIAVMLLPLGSRAQDAAEAPEAPPIDLRPVWETGRISRYQLSTIVNYTMHTASSPEPRTSAIQVTTESTWTVLEANPDGGGSCELMINKAELKLTGADGAVTTANDVEGEEGAEPYHQFAAGLVGTPITVEISPEGRVQSVAGWEPIRDNSGPLGAQLIDLDFREIAYKLAPLAGGTVEVAPGAQWNEQFEFDDILGRIDQDSQYEFIGVEEMAGIPIAMINRKSSLSIIPDEQEDVPEGMDMSMDVLEATQTSQIMVDMSRHEVVGMNIDKVIESRVTMQFGERQYISTTRREANIQCIRIAESGQ